MTKQGLLRKGTELFKQHGFDIKRDKFASIEDSPTICSIKKAFGNWRNYVSECKEFNETGAFPDQNTETKQETLSPSLEFLVKQNDTQRKKIEKLTNLNQILIDNCLANISLCSFKASRIPPPEKIKIPQEFHALRSDDHVGEKLEAAWVQGIAEFNKDEFVIRNNRWKDKVITFREQDKKSLGLNKLVLYMLGDHITGELIYAGQAYNIDMAAVDQLFFCLQEYVNTILALASVFPEIEIFMVIGNHGRMGKKGENHPRSNLDYILYRSIQNALERQPNVRVFVSESPTMIVQNGNYNFALNHNDNVRGYQGIPYYGLERKARRLSDLYGIQIHYKLGGHFHTPANLNDETILNGCLPGGSDLSINKMNVATRPSQKVFYFDPEHGINRESNLYLADPVKLTPDENGIYTAYTTLDLVEDKL